MSKFLIENVLLLENYSHATDIETFLVDHKLTRQDLKKRFISLNESSEQPLINISPQAMELTEFGASYLLSQAKNINLYRTLLSHINHKKDSTKEFKFLLLRDAALMILPIIQQFINENPETTVTIHTNTRLTLEHIFQYDLIVHEENNEFIKLDSFRIANIFNLERILCASPKYIKKFGAPKTIDDLISNHKVIDNTVDNGQWESEGSSIPYNWDLSVNSAKLYTQLILDGHGVGAPVSFFITPFLDSGELLPVLPNTKLPDIKIYTLKHDVRPTPPIIDKIIHTFQSILTTSLPNEKP